MNPLNPPTTKRAQALEVWSVYPRKKGKAAALPKIAQAIAEIGFFELFAKVQKYAKRAALIAADKKQFIPHGSTYFSARGWDDDDDGLQPWIDENKKSRHSHHGIGYADDHEKRARERMRENIEGIRNSAAFGPKAKGLSDAEIWRRYEKGEFR